MDTQRLTPSVSNSNSIHSSSPPSSDMGISKRICILVFSDDYICQNILSEVLQHCTYEVVHIGKAMDALSEIEKRKHEISVVLTNLNRLKTKGAEIIQAIEGELNLRVYLILPGIKEFEPRGQDCNVSSYIVNFSDTNDMKELWQSAFKKERARKSAIIRDSSPVVGVENNEPSLDGEPGNDHHNRKAKELREEQNEESGGEIKKKPRLSWNPDMHQKFVQAINKLGFDKAVPKKIVEFMNEPGLTREHVASHLQKYRMNLRKGQDGSTDFIYGGKLTNNATNPFYAPYPSALNFNNPSQTYNNSFFSTPLLGQSYLLNPNISTTLTQQPMFPSNHLQGALNHISPPQSINNLVSGIEKGHYSSGSSSVSINQQPSRFLGLRVVNDELQFGESCGQIIHRESSTFTADWTTSGNNNNNNNNNADSSVSSCSRSFNPIYNYQHQQQPNSVPFLETSADQSLNYSETISPGTFVPEQQASFPAFSSPYKENDSLLQGFSTQGINTNEDPSIISLPLPGNSENFSSKQVESSSSLSVPPAVIEINSYGGEEEISAMLDASENNTANQEEGVWDDDFSDILGGITD